jgi:8-oxo-dGTP diphosphatase
LEHYELTAAIALWRGPELLLMKREAGAFGGGGWFLPGGHVEAHERPVDAAARELREETGIAIVREALSLADVMTYERETGTAHCLVYNATCPGNTEVAMNEEHVVFRWYTAEAAVARFFDSVMLRERGVSERNIELAAEVGRVIMAASRARGMRGPGDRPDDARPTNW